VGPETSSAFSSTGLTHCEAHLVQANLPILRGRFALVKPGGVGQFDRLIIAGSVVLYPSAVGDMLRDEPLDGAGKHVSGMRGNDPARSVTWPAFSPATCFPV
jgi:hypothetical protein